MATLATQSNAASDVFPGGETLFEVQFETYMNSGLSCGVSGVTIGITASGAVDGGLGTPVAVTGDGITVEGMGLCTYTWAVPEDVEPGSYVVTWTGIRDTDSMTVTYTQAVNVAADPAAVPLPGVYASVAAKNIQNRVFMAVTSGNTCRCWIRVWPRGRWCISGTSDRACCAWKIADPHRYCAYRNSRLRYGPPGRSSA